MTDKESDLTFMERLKYAFRERQVYVRSEGHVRFVTFRPWSQVFLCVLLAGTIAWIAAATIDGAFSRKVIADKTRHTDELRTAYEQQLVGLNDTYKQRIEALSSVYEKRIESLRGNIMSINGRLMLNQGIYIAKLKALESVQQELEERHRLLKEVMKSGLGSDAAKTPKPIPKKRSSIHTGGYQNHAAAYQPIHVMRQRVKNLEDSQRTLLNTVERNRSREAKAIARTIRKLGLRPRSILSATKVKTNTVAMGGPFVALGSLDEQNRSFKIQLNRIGRYLNEIERYQTAVSAMPIIRPLPGNRPVTSEFGIRSDPINKVAAMHSGIDFGAPVGVPVKATAGGHVVRAGEHAGYGKLVVIRHNHGISTRYAHLNRINVKVGQQVKVNQTLGLVGSTGRSTGPHLHYEIRIFGKPIDPRRIWSAGYNVLKAKNN